ncbi:hypothetical protein [Verrucosispora sp. NA02020]|uniref:hypothetical protein n=1 Tax=Verrucosispora sp. NA02020 TaxID=2742132 RepID=UPI00159051ED|nr:hypothetical protein [Verrucosispora sp. NA02020]QKW15476.1 hypothetical protein HUT12_23695 [Verrucosispora sp. NA02020]
MLTDQQLTETALRLIDAELHHLATYDRTEQIDRLVREHHDVPIESGGEVRAAHQQVRDAVAFLRVDLVQYAAARNITIPIPQRTDGDTA